MAEKTDRKSLLRAGMEKETTAVERRFTEPMVDRWSAAEAAMTARPLGLAVGASLEASPHQTSARKVDQPHEGSLRVSIDCTHENPWNARRIYEPEKVATLAASIEAKGQVYPVPVCPHPEIEGHWILIDGHYRRRALQQIGVTDIYVLPRPTIPPREMFRLSYSLNEERSEQTALDNALAWSFLLAERIYETADDLAGAVGKSPAKVAKTLAILKMPQHALEVLRENPSKFGPAISYELYLCSQHMDTATLTDLARRVVSEDLSQREIERLRTKVESPNTRRTKEVSRQYKIRAGVNQIGTIKEWDSGRVALDVMVADPSERAALMEELKRRFGFEAV